jgi:hypothetical protein
VVTINAYTRLQNFDGAALVLSDLGEPAQPFDLLKGGAGLSGWVDSDLLRKLKD